MPKRFDKLYVNVNYNGYSRTMDDRIEGVIEDAGGEVSGSGFGFGGRDVNGIFKTARAVLSFKRKLHKTYGCKRTKVSVNNNRTFAAMPHVKLLARARLEKEAGK
jgi:hypothetical protein